MIITLTSLKWGLNTAKYNTLPDNLKNLLPEPGEIADRLEILDDLR